MRRIIIGGLAVVLVTLGLGDEGLAQKVPVPRGELRIVDKRTNNWAIITWNVMDHLVELDRDGNLVPRLATGWRWLDEQTLEMKLRRGVKFHNGEAFDAEIVKLNWGATSRPTRSSCTTPRSSTPRTRRWSSCPTRPPS